MTKTEQKEAMKELFVKGRKIKLADGSPGIFSGFMSGNKTARVIIGDINGKLTAQSVQALGKANWSDW